MTLHLEIEVLFNPAQAAVPDERHCPSRKVVHVVRGRPGPDDRPALPSGHPDTWGLINAGTCIEGASYPFPIFPR
jgi:hypothetical protein